MGGTSSEDYYQESNIGEKHCYLLMICCYSRLEVKQFPAHRCSFGMWADYESRWVLIAKAKEASYR